jgi:hypothetical protein
MKFFSFLKLIKTYLRLKMGNDRLSDLLIIAVECDITAKVSFR